MNKTVWMATAVAVGAALVITTRAQGPAGDRDDRDRPGQHADDRPGIVDHDGDELRPSGKGWGERPNNPPKPEPPKAPKAPAPPPKTVSNGIDYHNGPVMLGTTNVYYIWYGNWSGNTATSILTDFASGIGGSPYFNINTTYYNGSGTHVSNSVALKTPLTSPYHDNYSRGTALTDADIQTIVSSAISSHGVPSDTSGVYFVLTSADVNEKSGFCTQYCGWHTHGSIGGQDIKYAFVGNPDRCPNACAAQSTGPNGNAGADGMASIIAHELEESVTDPDLNAWYDKQGNESADKCAWTFGSYSRLPNNGAAYNMTLNAPTSPTGKRNYLIQQQWVNASGGYCAKAY